MKDNAKKDGVEKRSIPGKTRMSRPLSFGAT
jgi:hypothetical protein